MCETIVRLSSITIKNFKNVTYGDISFENTRKNYKSSILGLYGQNGSGKTALIDVITLLKYILSGTNVPAKYADYINLGSEYSNIKYIFKIENKKTNCFYNVIYEVKIKKEIDQLNSNVDSLDTLEKKYKTIIYDEILSSSYEDEKEKNILKPIIDTSKESEFAFEPKNRYISLIGKNKDDIINVKAYKTITLNTSRSFIFSKELNGIIRKNENCEKKYKFLLESLIYYGNYELFIFNTTNNGLISMNALPIAFRIKEQNKSTVGSLMIKLEGTTIIPNEALEVVRNVISNMNIVLEQIVPGLTIAIKEVGTDIFPNNTAGTKIYLVSNKNNKEIPLKYESEGIKKIISILQLLIVLYNNSSITVAIDELDSGVFEYLLGEILKIISEKGKGQLIFTSHNLRPLETLDKGFIAFTTTNSNNRYIRFTNVKTNNNLRDFYYRDIILGEQSECIYDETNNYEIDLAFKEAGEFSGS